MNTSAKLLITLFSLSIILNITTFSFASSPPWLLSQQEREKVGTLLSDSWKEEDRSSQEQPGVSFRPNTETLEQLKSQLKQLQAALNKLPKDEYGLPPADVEVWARAVSVPINNDEWLTAHLIEYIKYCLNWGMAIAEEYGKNPDCFSRLRGSFMLGFRSQIDRSAQIYGVTLPESFDPNRKEPYRLWIYLHGHTSWVMEAPSLVPGMVNASIDKPLSGEERSGQYSKFFWGEGAPNDENTISVRPFGRFNGGYSGPSETDVMEVVQDACRRYPINPDKIVLNGFSMGSMGTVSVGLLNPGKFAGIAPMAGMPFRSQQQGEKPVDYSAHFSPLTFEEINARFMQIRNIEAVAVNCKGLPIVMTVGTKDRLSQGHRQFETVLDSLGVEFTSTYIGNWPHSPMKLHSEQVFRFLTSLEREPEPKEIYFATTHLSHAERAWVRIDGMKRQYQRAEVHARAVPDSNVIIIETKGISYLSIKPGSELISRNNLTVLLDNKKIPLPSTDWKEVSFKLTGDSWGISTADIGLRKRPGITGPVSDAFNHGFLCVVPTGKPWNTQTAQFADTLLTDLKKRWSLQYRGELPVKKDIEVTNEDIKRYNLILFGDPGSNKIIKDVVSQMSKKQKPGVVPLYFNWSKKSIELGTTSFSSMDYVPALVYPNPASPEHYIVINGTIPQQRMRGPAGGARIDSVSAVIPMVDFAVIKFESNNEKKMGISGYFNEEWGLELAKLHCHAGHVWVRDDPDYYVGRTSVPACHNILIIVPTGDG